MFPIIARNIFIYIRHKKSRFVVAKLSIVVKAKIVSFQQIWSNKSIDLRNE